MLRALDPENDYQPKSKTLIPTDQEKKKFSENELAHIEQQVADDEDWKVARASRQLERSAVLKIAENLGVGGESTQPNKLSRRT